MVRWGLNNIKGLRMIEEQDYDESKMKNKTKQKIESQKLRNNVEIC